MTSSSEANKYADFLEEVRNFLAQKLTPELRAASKRQAGIFADAQLGRTWHRILYEQGWVAPNWPREHGGPGWDAVQRFLFQDELAKAGAPKAATFGVQLCGPVIMQYGTAAQKAHFLPKILSGEHYWCQGYSEPGAGSDLASLRTTAVRHADHYVVNGSKIWTTHAHNANWIFALVRTDPTAKPHRGLSFLLLPIDSPGLTISPILSMSGEHELNQVFFDNVRVPVENRVGEENDGWGISKYLLEFERGTGAAASRIQELLRQARMLAQGPDATDAESLWRTSPHFRRQITEMEIEVLGLEFAEREIARRLAAGEQVGSMASRLKLSASTLLQRATELNMEALGIYATVDQRDALGSSPATSPVGPPEGATVTARYLNTRAVTIYGGTYEVQHNILARMIGL
jgi:alkylation response protein AidB-like acyl-CoA dehydrogenase